MEDLTVTTILIVVVLLIAALGIVYWATRKKPSVPTNAPGESDTAWNDPLTPNASARPHIDQDPRP